jgi:hypothetical protein
LRNNIIGARYLYECARAHGIRPDDPIRPDSDYGAGKAWAEALAREYCELYGVSSMCLRIGSVLPDDDPRLNPRTMKTWLSHRDLSQLSRKCLQSTLGYGIYYGVSDNYGRFWDISNARSELGCNPQDDASRLLPE